MKNKSVGRTKVSNLYTDTGERRSGEGRAKSHFRYIMHRKHCTFPTMRITDKYTIYCTSKEAKITKGDSQLYIFPKLSKAHRYVYRRTINLDIT